MTEDSESIKVELNEFRTWLEQANERFRKNDEDASSNMFLHLALLIGVFVSVPLLGKIIEISEATALRGTIVAVSFLVICSIRDILTTLVRATIAIALAVRYTSVRQRSSSDLPPMGAP